MVKTPYSTEDHKDPPQKLGMLSLDSGTYTGHFRVSNETPLPWGDGVLQSLDGLILREGEWQSGDLNGIGKETLLFDDISYTGQFVMGVKQGIGSLVTKERTSVGTFKEGALHGAAIVSSNLKDLQMKGYWHSG